VPAALGRARVASGVTVIISTTDRIMCDHVAPFSDEM